MKKFMILLAVACLIFVSCGTKKQVEAVEETCCMTEMLAKWDTYADLDEADQIALVAEMKAFLDKKCEGKCQKEEGEEVAEEVCPEKAAQCAEMKAKWEDFDNLLIEDQKALIDQILEHMAKCCKAKEVAEEVAEEAAE